MLDSIHTEYNLPTCYTLHESLGGFIMNKVLSSISKTVAKAALSVTQNSANSACIWVIHQSKLPDAAKKLRKF